MPTGGVIARQSRGAHDFILELAEGYDDTIVGERGSTLSAASGQRLPLPAPSSPTRAF